MGTGRAILAASRFAFRKIVGVEYSEQLNQVARENVSRFPAGEMQCREIAIVCHDAASFPLPERPPILFLYSPFGKQVMTPRS